MNSIPGKEPWFLSREIAVPYRGSKVARRHSRSFAFEFESSFSISENCFLIEADQSPENRSSRYSIHDLSEDGLLLSAVLLR